MGKKTYRVKPKIKIEKPTKDEQVEIKPRINITKALSREIKFTILIIFATLILLIAGSYSIFTAINKSDEYFTITAGTLKIDFLQENKENLNLNNAYPIMDSEADKLDSYKFKITNTGTLRAAYKIKLLNDQEIIAEDDCGSKLLSFSSIKVKINQETPFLLSDKEANSYVVAEGSLLPQETKEYEVKVWVKDTAGNESLNKHYHGKIVVDSVNVNTD